MELKKNPNVDPKRNSMLFFQVGLAAIMLLTYIGIEMKSYKETTKPDELFVTDNLVVDDEEVIITLPPVQRLPPPPPPAPEVIEVVKDEIKLEEKKIETTEVEENKPVVVVKASDVGEPGGDFDDIPDEMPFTVIEQVPMFPGCEKEPKSKQAQCFQDKLDALVKKNFNMPDDLEPGFQARVFVNFLIDKDGNITEIKTRGGKGSEDIEKEAIKAFNKLPKIIPGKQRGKPVKVRYTYPITIKIQ